MMKFDEIMDFGGEANRVTYQKIREAIQNGNLIPFVGAGLSKDAGYPLWAEALKQLNKFAKPSEQTYVESIIDSDPEEAADRIEKSIGPRKMHGFLVDIFGEKDDINIKRYAAGILPYLFPSQLIMTTNFDRVVENAFRVTKNTHIEPTVPSNAYLGRKLLAEKSTPSLYKVHGDVNSPYEDIVFSKASYNKHYTRTTEITQALSAVFIAKHLFFLGCSLQNDRTLRLLQSVSTEGTSHFAIVDEKEEDVCYRRRELSENYGIDAILYPSGDYECVKAILSRLLEDIDPDAFRVCVAYHGAMDTSTNKFVYTSLNTDFIGRDEEFQELLRFIEGDARPVTWWALTGIGGSGKSRLVYELIKHMEDHIPGWHAITFKRSEKITPALLTERIHAAGGNVFIVIDYMQTGLRHIAEWIDSINFGSRCVRVLFLQRDGTKTLDQDILPSWLREILDAPNNLRNLLWKTELLYLEPWKNPETIKNLMRSYAVHMNRAGALDEFLDELCETLQAKEEKLLLPLFAMFIADAKLEGKDPCQWDAEQLLNWFCTRERDIHRKQLEGIHENLGICLHDYETLIVLTTIINSWELPTTTEDAYSPYQQLIYTISETLHLVEHQAIDQCIEWEILILDDENSKLTFRSIEPDPFGEFFVLWFLKERLQQHGGKKAIEGLMQEVSQNIVAGNEFFFRTFTDYGEYLEGKWLALRNYLCSFTNWLDDVFDLSVARRVISFAVITENDDLSTSENAMICAGDIAQKYKKNAFANLMYARGLANMSYIQGAENCATTIALLCTLTEQFPQNEEIVLEYAKGLVNLSAKQDTKSCVDTVDVLRGISERFPKNEEIVLRYVKGLFNLSDMQDAASSIATIALLRGIAEKFSKNENIVIEYAKRLSNSSVNQDAKSCADTVALLRVLVERFPQSEVIALAYAQGLVNLSAKQDAVTSAASVVLLHTLTERFPKNEEIALMYSLGLGNLSIKQDAGNAITTIGLLYTLTEQWSENEEIAQVYAKGMGELSAKQDAKNCATTIGLLHTLTEQWPENEEITLAYAIGLGILFNKQQGNDREGTLERLRLLAENHAQNEMIVILYKYLFQPK